MPCLPNLQRRVEPTPLLRSGFTRRERIKDSRGGRGKFQLLLSFGDRSYFYTVLLKSLFLREIVGFPICLFYGAVLNWLQSHLNKYLENLCALSSRKAESLQTLGPKIPAALQDDAVTYGQWQQREQLLQCGSQCLSIKLLKHQRICAEQHRSEFRVSVSVFELFPAVFPPHPSICCSIVQGSRL